tara:strand:+ start:261 stop:485 length:225 start_codon:yes stop_codon:yes gene_type:complete
MSHFLNELISMNNVKAVEDEAKTAEVIAKHSVRIRDGLSRIEKAKEEWEPEYHKFDPGPQEGVTMKSRATKSRS